MGLIEKTKNIIEWYEWFIPYIKSDKRERLSLQEERTEPIHVIMNGPSLKDSLCYVNKFPGKILMVNSAILNLGKFDGLKPDYYCLADPEYNNPQKSCMELVVNTRNALEQYKGRMELFIPSQWKKNFEIKNPKIKTKYVISIPVPRGKHMYKKMRLNKAAPAFQGVVIMGLYVALQLGYKCIYLHGAEEGYMKYFFINKKNELCMKNEYVYGSKEINLTIERGFHMLDEYRGNVYLYENLYLLKIYSEMCKAEIVNMSQNSMIDCFDRYDYSLMER